MNRALIAFLCAAVLPAPAAGQVAPAHHDSVGAVRASVAEFIDPSDSVVTLTLSINTSRNLSCLGFNIAHSAKQIADTVWVKLDSIVPPRELCFMMVAPASAVVPLQAHSPRLLVLIRSAAQTDSLLLTTSAESFALEPLAATFVEVDRRVRWRRPANSFAFRCGALPRTSEFCDDIGSWIDGLPGVSRLDFPEPALSPYFPGGMSDNGVSYYRFGRSSVLTTIAECFARIAPLIREAVGVGADVIPWVGKPIEISSSRSFYEPHIEIPGSVTANAGCS